MIARIWQSIGDIGKDHCKTPHDTKSVRFLNYICVVGSVLILLYSLQSYAQFNFKYGRLFLLELSFVPVLSSLLLFTSRGWFNVAKSLGIILNLAYLFLLYISIEIFIGGPYMILITAVLPIIIFQSKWVYSSFFLLHIMVFFITNEYIRNNPPILSIPESELKSVYVSSIIIMFLLLFFSIQYFLSANQFYEKLLQKSKTVIEDKQKEILDSISYAKRLQQAILPPTEFITKNFSESFILYKPKDIVAGDFYWAEQAGNLFFIAAADCTGHGVPGAMVSVVCSNALNRTVKEFGLTDTGKILNKTRELVIETFEKSNEEVKDGMDVSLLCIDKQNQKVFWSGANNPLWFVHNGQLTEITADKQPVGKSFDVKPFTTKEIEYKTGTTFYLFTDGLPDQFGGPKGKKFKYKQFEELLISINNQGSQQQADTINQKFEEWKGTHEQVDDVCVIGIKI